MVLLADGLVRSRRRPPQVSARWSRPFAEHARGDRESGVDAVLSGCGVLRMGRAPSGQGPGLVLITPAGPPSLTRT